MAGTRTFLDIVNRLSPSVPGCPTPIIEQYVRDAAIEACERTLAWRYEQPRIRLVVGAHDYAYESPTDAEIHAFITATVNDEVLTPVTLDKIYELYPKWPNQPTTSRAKPRHITQLDPDHFSVAPVPVPGAGAVVNPPKTIPLVEVPLLPKPDPLLVFKLFTVVQLVPSYDSVFTTLVGAED